MGQLDTITAMYGSAVPRLWSETDYYRSFLKTSARMYKYPFKHQVLIHEQRPDAIACAKADTWGDNKIRRRIKDNAVKIGLVDDSGNKPVPIFIFDITDTEKADGSGIEPYIWQIDGENRKAVISELGTESRDIDSALIEKAHDLAEEYADSYLIDYSDEERSAYTNLLENSVAYMLLTRCGYNADAYYSSEDLSGISECSTMEKMFGIGCVISDHSEQILRTVERAVKDYTRRVEYERNEQHPEPYDRGNDTWEIRDTSQEFSAGEQEYGIPNDERARDIVQPLSRNGESGGEPTEPYNRTDETGTGRDGADESVRPNEVGRSDEQYSAISGGNSFKRADLQLNEAKVLINDYCVKEFGENADFTYLSRVGIAYTTDENSEIPIQVYADLLNYRIIKLYGENIVNEEAFSNIYEMLPALANLNFDELVALSDEEKAKVNINEAGNENPAFTISSGSFDIEPNSDSGAGEEISFVGGENLTEQPITVTCLWSEDANFEDGKTYSLSDFDSLMKRLDDEHTSIKQAMRDKYGSWEKWYESGENTAYLGYNKTKFCINLPNGDTIIDRQDIGDGYGGLIDYMRQFAEYTEILPVLEEALRAEREAAEVSENFVAEWYICDKDGMPISDSFSTKEEAEAHFSEYSEADYIDSFDTLVDDVPETDVPDISAENSPMANDEDIPTTKKELTAMRVGDFYEFFGDDAKIAADTLDLFLTSRNGLPMAGIPEHAFNAYREQLETTGFTLKIEEFDANKIRKPEPAQFTITDESLGEGGDKSKFKANIEAIKTLKALEAENRAATIEEMETLSRYVGWGGLSQAFEKDNNAWAKEYEELRSILTEDEYISARASVNNAHYTTPIVANAIYEGLSNLGFKGGSVLEPAVGVGNFFGSMPEEMRRSSDLYGVEIDSISGRIAQKIYPKAKIQIKGFEETDFKDGKFDVAVGNVPFGQYKLSEKRYDKLKLNIHDHFFVKSLDKVREGGVVAFVTSKGTLDKENPKVRQYLAERAELIGAIRLPGGKNGAFKGNAGTEVTTDIIFLQKRDHIEKDIKADWIEIGATPDGIPVNKYFEMHPEMILGEMKQGVEFSLYGNTEETACVPIEGADLKEQLKEAVTHIQGTIPERRREQKERGYNANEAQLTLDGSTAADENPEVIVISEAEVDYSGVRNFSYTTVGADIYYREGGELIKQDFPRDKAERVRGMIEITQTVRELIDYQLNEYPDNVIKTKQLELNEIYDDFVSKFGLISSDRNSRAFREDSSFFLLSSLEILDENGKLERKADMFTKRTIKPRVKITSVDTSVEALAVSISEKARVDIPYMAKLTSKTESEVIGELRGIIFRVPEMLSEGQKPHYVTADEYLSGNIREKLQTAKLANEALGTNEFAENISALELAMPKPLEATEIEIRLGATWVKPEYIKQFMFEILQTPTLNRYNIDVQFSEYTSEWHIEGKSEDSVNVMANTTFGTARKNAYSIIEDTLNLRDARVYDYVLQPDGKTKAVLNQKETMLAQEKQEAIKCAFREWIFRDPERREELVEKYNELFNSTRPREYDGSHLSFVGMNPEITLRTHQLNAIAHTIYGGNTLLAHQVGAGKTYEMVASAMESKRLGLCSKSLFVVPNHLTEQMGAEFLRLYPTANILVATKKDFEAQNRKRLCAKIATGNYDAIIIGHSQLEKIPVSAKRQEQMIKNQITEISNGIEDLKRRNGTHYSVKQLEKTKKSLEAKLKNLLNGKKRDDVVTFEELGVDRMYIDEAHNFKNLFLYTKMRNVAGIQQSEAQKSSDLYMKCQYMDEVTGGRGTVFSTGTPIAGLQQIKY